jgi:hypothetical protein
MIAMIHQPEYLPWLGFFDKLYRSDLYVILDSVQFERLGFQNRNRIKTDDRWKWLTVPVVHSLGQRISEVKISYQTTWREKHWEFLRKSYGRAQFFQKYSGFFRETYLKNWSLLSQLNIHMIKGLMSMLGIEKPLVLSSSLGVDGKATELLINICKEVGADVYLSGTGGREYLDLKRFADENLKVKFREYSPPTYPQQYEKNGFIPYMSTVDLLFNCGEKSLDIILSGGKIV